MRRTTLRAVAVICLLSFAAVTQHVSAASRAITGPSSSRSPYVARSVPGVVTKSILTVGDSVNAKPDGSPYRMVGIHDGLGAFDIGDVQAHYSLDGELVEGGQLFAIHVPPGQKVGT